MCVPYSVQRRCLTAIINNRTLSENVMYAINALRQSVADALAAKVAGTAAKTNLWANYVRATMYEDAPRDENTFDARHAKVCAELEAVRPMTKDEKNSLASAKCIVKKAVMNSIDVWQRDDSDNIVFEGSDPTPRGKSDLQNAKSDFDRVTDSIEALIKLMGKETREPFSDEQLETIASRLLVVAANVGAEREALKARAAEEAPF
jgi:hypothetical protein